MIVYAESNFILELAFHQEEHESCLTLLSLAESNKIELVLPAFSIGESYEVWVRRSKRRKAAYDTLVKEVNELSRSKPYRHSNEKMAELNELLLNSPEEEKSELDNTLERILNLVELVPIGLNVIRAAITFQKTHDLSPQDAIVYASILEHKAKKREASCFITKNSKDFFNPKIENELATYNCRLLTKFRHGVGYIRSHL
jgi:predicted nucleic acid-binding protein